MSLVKAEASQANLTRKIDADRSYEISKRLIDVVVSGSLIGLSLPLFATLALIIKLTSPGPIIFRQRRLARGTGEFWCYKYRTMVVDAERRLLNNDELRARFDTNFKLKNDPRITSIGAFLRKTSLDELPQLFNVLEGSMSLIGPRPIVAREHSKYHSFRDKLLTVKPGLGGYWQVYRRAETTYDERVQMDMSYINSRCLSLDLKLMIFTLYNALMRRGAY